jgi:two-component system C4-dicarboxylate transport response regulator DctD
MADETPADGTPPPVLLIDDDQDLLRAQAQGLEIAGFSVRAFPGGAPALKEVSAEFEGVVLSDVRMPQMDGLAVFRRVLEIDAEIPVILLTGHGDVPTAVQALKDGAYDFLTKPCPIDELTASLRRAVQKRRLVLENRQLRRLHAEHDPARTSLLGASPAMAHLRQNLARIAEADVDVLIVGDSGVGKEAVARALHRMSERRARPFVHVNCASLPDETFQAELLGVEPGVRFGAYGAPTRRSAGRLEKAHRGVLLLDDVDGLSLAQQAKLLGVIEAREVWALGADAPRPLDIRVVATTRTDLDDAVRRGAFRADLFYRLSGITLRVPALRERRGDIPLLFQHLLVSACARLRQPIPRLSAPVHAYLQSHDWPGNVRELEHFAERLALGLEDARLPRAGGERDPPPLAERVAEFEAELIRETLSVNNGDAQASMRQLKLPRKTFYDKLSRHGIRIAEFRSKPSRVAPGQ